MHKEQNYSAL